MSDNAHQAAERPLRVRMTADMWTFAEAFRQAWPPLLFGLRMWASVSLALYVAYWLQLDNPYWAGTSAAIVCQPQLGASLRKGWFRILGTIVGAVMSVVLVACFAQDRVLFLGSLVLWAAACAFVAVLLHNFASYAASLAGYTAAIIGAALLGTVGGIDANAAFLLAVSRATAICTGIVCAGIVLAGTDLAGSRRRVASVLAELVSGLSRGLVGTLNVAGKGYGETRVAQREFLRRIIALDPIIDQALGESSQVRYHSPVIRQALDGLFSALAGWYGVANHLAHLRASVAEPAAAAILQEIPQDVRAVSEAGGPVGWLAAPHDLYRICATAAKRIASLPAESPSLQLLGDKVAKTFAGVADALNGLALLADDPAGSDPVHGNYVSRVPDWLPAAVAAGRTFVAVGAVALFWIVTGWPGGALAMTFAAIVELLLAPRADETYGAAVLFVVGAILDLILTATVSFAALPALHTDGFFAFSLILGVCLVPIGALLRQARQPWQVGLFSAMTMGFMPILQPTNPEIYNPESFYNIGFAIVVGMSTGALSFRLMPPLSPAYRTRRLLSLTLRDLRRLAKGRRQRDWEDHVVGRLSSMPDEAEPDERAQLWAALTVGSEIVRLRDLMPRLALGAALNESLESVAQGESARAIVQLGSLDGILAERPEGQITMRARGSIREISEVLMLYSAYFDAGAPA